MASTEEITDERDNVIAELENKIQIIQKMLSTLGQLDLLIDVISYKIFETQHEYRTQMDELSSEKETISSDNLPSEEVALRIAEIERIMNNCTNTHQESISVLETQKNDLKKEFTLKIQTMDSALEELKAQHNTILNKLETLVLSSNNIDASRKMEILQNMYENDIDPLNQLQSHGWKDYDSQEIIAASLEDRGLRVTPSNKFLTRSGKLLTISEVTDLGLLDELSLGSWTDLLTGRKKSDHTDLSTSNCKLKKLCATSIIGKNIYKLLSRICDKQIGTSFNTSKVLGKPMILTLTKALHIHNTKNFMGFLKMRPF